MSQRKTFSRTSGSRVDGAELFRTAAPPGFLRSQWRAGKSPSLWFNSEDRTPLLRVWKQLRANSDGRGNNPSDVISFEKKVFITSFGLQNKSLKWWRNGKFALLLLSQCQSVPPPSVRNIKYGWGVFPCRWSDPRKATVTLSVAPCAQGWLFYWHSFVFTLFFKRGKQKQAVLTLLPNKRVLNWLKDREMSRGCFGWRREQIKSSSLQMNPFSVKFKWSGRRNTWPWTQTVSGHHF